MVDLSDKLKEHLYSDRPFSKEAAQLVEQEARRYEIPELNIDKVIEGVETGVVTHPILDAISDELNTKLANSFVAGGTFFNYLFTLEVEEAGLILYDLFIVRNSRELPKSWRKQIASNVIPQAIKSMYYFIGSVDNKIELTHDKREISAHRIILARHFTVSDDDSHNTKQDELVQAVVSANLVGNYLTTAACYHFRF